MSDGSDRFDGAVSAFPGFGPWFAAQFRVLANPGIPFANLGRKHWLRRSDVTRMSDGWYVIYDHGVRPLADAFVRDSHRREGGEGESPSEVFVCDSPHDQFGFELRVALPDLWKMRAVLDEMLTVRLDRAGVAGEGLSPARYPWRQKRTTCPECHTALGRGSRSSLGLMHIWDCPACQARWQCRRRGRLLHLAIPDRAKAP